MQLSFMPTSSPASSSLPEAVRDRAAFVSIDDSPSPRKKQMSGVQMLPTPRPSVEGNRPVASSPLAKRTTRSFVGGIASSPAIVSSSRSKKSSRVIDDSDSDDQIPGDDPRSSPPRSTKRTAIVESDSDEPVVPKQAAETNGGIITFDDSESDEPTFRSSPTKRKRTYQPSPIRIDSSDENSRPSKKSKKSHRSNRRPIRQRQESPFVVDDDDEDELLHDSSSAEVTDADIDNEQEETLAPRRRRHRSSPQAAAEKAELDSDLEFLGDAQIEIPPTLRTKKQSRQSMLDRLKANRAKKQVPARASRIVVDDDEEADESSHDSDKSEQGTVDKDWLYEHEDHEDSFINDDGAVEDEKVALPFQFSNYSTMKPLELFKFVIEWMVQKKINPVSLNTSFVTSSSSIVY